MNHSTTHHSSGHHSPGHHQAAYNFWTWVVAIVLALVLLWMLLTGRGPSAACCSTSADMTSAVATEAAPAVMPAEPTVNDAFSFNATSNGFSSNGDGTNVTWLAQSGSLSTILSGADLSLKGDDKAVVLTGTVATDTIKQQKSADLQAFFGPNVEIDNQLVVQAADMAADSVPAAIKLYFDSGKTALPADASISLAAIVDWLKSHPESKVILSGYHDPKGNKASNEALAKERAESVEDALEAAGIDEERIDKRKPQSVDGGADLSEARRVEVSIE